MNAAKGLGQESPARLRKSSAMPFMLVTMATRRIKARVRKIIKFQEAISLRITDVAETFFAVRDRLFAIEILLDTTVA